MSVHPHFRLSIRQILYVILFSLTPQIPLRIDNNNSKLCPKIMPPKLCRRVTVQWVTNSSLPIFDRIVALMQLLSCHSEDRS